MLKEQLNASGVRQAAQELKESSAPAAAVIIPGEPVASLGRVDGASQPADAATAFVSMMLSPRRAPRRLAKSK